MLKPFFAIFVTTILSFCTYNSLAQTPLIADAGSDVIICSTVEDGIKPHFIGGQPSASGGVPPYIYSWSFSYSPSWASDTSYASDFFNDTTLANPTLVWMEIGNRPEIPPFILTVTDSLGNMTQDTVQIQMSYFNMILPQYYFHINQGDSFYMNREPDVHGGTGSLSWLWRPNHGLIDSTNAHFWAKPDTSIEYYVTGTDSLGCSQKGGQSLVVVIVSPLSIQNQEPKTNIKIYPNPTTNFIQIEIEEITKTKVFTLYDMLGKEVLTTTLSSSNQTIDVSQLARGNYSFVIGESSGKIVLR